MVFKGKFFDEIRVGESFGNSLTVTDSHITLGCGMFGDFNPLHCDDEFCKDGLFGERVLHGPLTGALMSASIGIFFSGSALAYLEHNCVFHSPVRVGDTLKTIWEIVSMKLNKGADSGVVALQGICFNQRGDKVGSAEGKIMIKASCQ